MARKIKSPIGLAMLDLVSNSLAAVIILFIIVSSLRLPSIPPERVKGTLYIKYSLSGNPDIKNAVSKVWLRPPNLKGKVRFWDNEIFELNTDIRIFGQFMDCNGNAGKVGKISAGRKGFLTPCAMIYSPIEDKNTHYLVIRNPIKNPSNDKWRTGILYVDHNGYENKKQFVEAKIEAWFIKGDEITNALDSTKIFGPTGSLKIEFDTPDWNNPL